MSLPAAGNGRVWGRRLLGLATHLIGLALMVFVSLGLAEDASLWVFGRHAEARVIASWIERDASRSEAEPSYRWFVRYAFTTADGRATTGISCVSAAEFAALGTHRPAELVSQENEDPGNRGANGPGDGPTVDVVYFPPLPTHNRLDDSRYAALLACSYVPLIVAGWVGLALGRSLLRAA